MRRDVYYYFQQACRRQLQPVTSRMRFVTEDDAQAGFLIDLDQDGFISEIEYRCTTCMTLVALCEHISQALRGLTVEEARQVTADEILRRHPEIPPARQRRARLAISAAMENLST